MNWVFCNKCSQKVNPNVKFYLSECGHIFCRSCLIPMEKNKQCSICKKSTTIVELSKDMDYSTQMFFWPLQNILEQSLKIFNFQSMHKSLFVESMMKKYNFAKKECIANYNSKKKLQKEVDMLREILKANGLQAPPFITSTPSNMYQRPYNDNISILSSINLTPRSAPGSAQRLYYAGHMMRSPGINASCQDPSPSQRVPTTIAPIHKVPTMNHLPVPMSSYVKRFHDRTGHPSMGYPRK